MSFSQNMHEYTHGLDIVQEMLVIEKMTYCLGVK